MKRELRDNLIGLERQRARAWLDRDEAALRALTDDDFIEINYFGRLTRAQILSELFPHLTLKKFDMTGFELLASVSGLAILSYRADEEINYKGKDIEGVFHVTAVYRQRGDKWLLLVWQITPYMPESG